MGPRDIKVSGGMTGMPPGVVTVQSISILIDGKPVRFVRMDTESNSELSPVTANDPILLTPQTALYAAYLFARAGLVALLHFWH